MGIIFLKYPKYPNLSSPGTCPLAHSPISRRLWYNLVGYLHSAGNAPPGLHAVPGITSSPDKGLALEERRPMMTSKGQLEDNISKALIKFEKEHLGRGPEEVKTFILGDMILVRLKGILTPAEQQLAKSDEGKILVKQVRIQLIENSRNLLEDIVRNLTGRSVISLHTDVSTVTGERVFIFTLDKELFPA
ncbi:MAG: DUF2294 domain-containing protein [Bacillota bacterium]